MARTDTYQLSVITPEQPVLEAAVHFTALPAWDGEVGILPHRAPLLVKLGVGWLRAETAQGKRSLLLDGGFAQMVGDRLTVLTERAEKPEDIDPGDAERALAEAEALEVTDDASFEHRQRALAHARARLQGAGAREL